MNTSTIGQQATAITMFRGRPARSISKPAGHIHNTLRRTEPIWKVPYCETCAIADAMSASRSSVRWKITDGLASPWASGEKGKANVLLMM
jgi:hypothetical protein